MSRRRHRISLDDLRLLDAIDRQGSFSAAARQLCVVTSAVAHAVRGLEGELGLVLFDRSGGRARFTSKGRALLDSGRPLLARAAAFDDEVQLIATGWEPALTISVDQVIPLSPLMALVQAFFDVAPQTALTLRREAAAGSWDALISGRADLIVGAPAGAPTPAGCESVSLFDNEFVLAVAVRHPLAARAGRISMDELAQHRSVVVGDTTRHLPNLPYSLQDHRLYLSVPDPGSKLDAILRGVGCGFVPRRVAEPLVQQGRLAVLDVDARHPPSRSTLAWRSGEAGRALQWWIDQLTQPGSAETLFHGRDEP